MNLGLPSAARDAELPRRLAWVTALRLGFLIALLAATSFLYLNGDLNRYPASQRVMFLTLGSGFVLALGYALALRRGRHLGELAVGQLVADQLTWTAIVYASGGPGSGATSFYALTCVLGAVLVGLRGAAIAALSGIGVYVVLCVAFATHALRPPSDQLGAAYATTLEAMAYPLATNVLGIGLVASLAGYLAERLTRTGGALALASARAEEAERLAVLGRIAAGLAHEIRNPLGSISGSVEMLRESPELSEEDRQLCAIIFRESLRLNDLVTDMMDLARPRAPSPRVVDLGRIAREVRALASHSERSASGDVEVCFVGPEDPALAVCDPAQMKQVLWNLVRNAVQVTRAGSVVTIRVEPHDHDVLVEVEDGGPGIAAPDRARIFDAFYTTRATGAGLGLAVVKRIVEDHAQLGARIEVRSPAGAGAVFSVTLPRAAEGDREAPAAEPTT
ncbi:MAG TPA: ATP-binding protein [Polyangiaceae bacterium]|nr:ATP-binding protein [Polyangiaceae bacterium]